VTSPAPPISEADRRGSPEVLADAIMARIFRGDFPPGSRLPAERQLAAQLSVDRTTLRMALKQLQRMNLVVVRHGSGVEVSDYRARGGLDVLAAMFSLDEVPLDPGLVLEAIDFWQEGFAMIAARAIARMTMEDLRCIEVLLDRSLRNVDDLDAFLDAQLAIQEELARLSGSAMFRMLSNSTRSVRRRIMRLLPATVDMTASLSEMKRLLRLAVATRPGEGAIRAGLLEALGQQSEPLRRQLLLGEPEKKKIQKKKGDRHGAGTGRATAHRGGAGGRVR